MARILGTIGRRSLGSSLILDFKNAAYGHFGRDEPEFTWEKTDKVAALRAAAGLQALT